MFNLKLASVIDGIKSTSKAKSELEEAQAQFKLNVALEFEFLVKEKPLKYEVNVYHLDKDSYIFKTNGMFELNRILTEGKKGWVAQSRDVSARSIIVYPSDPNFDLGLYRD